MKTALVTGAGGGLGQAICTRLAADGFQIIALDLSPTEKLIDRLSAIGTKLELAIGGVDFTDSTSIRKALDTILPHKELTVLVNNAGVSVGGKLLDGSLDDWQTMMAVNLTAPFIISQSFAKNLQERELRGSIVNISSMVGVVGAKKPGYAASKAGLLGLTKSIAMQTGSFMRCNAIYPGAMNTPMTADWDEATRTAIAKSTPLGRIAQPQEIANIVSFLADEKQSSFITGAAINATGGQYLGQ